MVPKRCRVTESGMRRDRVDAEIGLLQQMPGEKDPLRGQPVMRGGADFGFRLLVREITTPSLGAPPLLN